VRVLAIATVLPTRDRPEQARFIVEHISVLRQLAEVEVVELSVGYGVARSARVDEREVPGLGVVQVVHASAPPLVAQRLAGRTIARLAHERGVGLLHSHSLETAYAASVAARTSRMPWLHTEHSSEWTDQQSKGLVAAYVAASRRRVRSADGWTAVSHYLAHGMQAGGVRGPIALTPNVVDLDRPTRRPRAVPPGGPIRVIGVGLLNQAKRPVLAVEAFARVSGARPGSTFTWIGLGDQESAFVSRAAELGLKGAVQVLPPMPQAAYRQAMSEHDVLLLPTRFETFSVVAAEALAAGLPVVMGDRGGHTSFVTTDVGVLVRGDEPSDFVAGIESAIGLLDHPAEWFRQAVAPFSQARVHEAFAAVYRRLGVVG